MATQKELLESIVSRLEALEAKKEEKKAEPVVESVGVEDVLEGPSDTIPSSYRLAVDNSLNKSFGIHIKGLGGNFKFTILVPDKYSSLNEEQRRILKVDQRPRVIDNGEGENGVKLWADKVFSSFSPSIQSLIVSDRTQEM